MPQLPAIVFCSSDNTADVARQVAPSFDRYWPDCPYPRFAFFSTAAAAFGCAGWQRIDAGSTAGWRAELYDSLMQLPEGCDRVLLFLDDFLLTGSVDTARVRHLVAKAEQLDAPYLRFVPPQRSIWAGLLRPLHGDVVRLSGSEPYYSSLQLALWKRSHLLAMLQSSGNIWEFEHQQPASGRHFAIRSAPPCSYIHVVEKGRWMPYAPRKFAAARLTFDAGSRPLLDASYMRRHLLRKLSFALAGYGPMRIRRKLGQSRHSSR